MIEGLKCVQERVHYSAKVMGAASPTVGSGDSKHWKKRAVQRMIGTKKLNLWAQENNKGLRLGVTQPKMRYCGHQSARLWRGQVLWLVGGTNLYYKKGWGPREVHRDTLGTITDYWKGGKGV
jgi:hypothetical protein